MTFFELVGKLTARLHHMIGFSQKEELTKELKSALHDLQYQSPELMLHFELRISHILNKHISDLSIEWQNKLVKSWTD
jgi:hypothetical protein